MDIAKPVSPYKLGYIAGLDGVRALGMFAVLVGHMGYFPGGVVAIDIFFALSGFLITALLLSEHQKRGSISIRNFYVGRAYRLLPAFFAYVAVGTVLVYTLKGPEAQQEFRGNALSSLFYVNNYYRIFAHSDGGSWFGHCWSLSLEEQFYLLWPPVLILLWRSESRRKHLAIWLMVAAFAVTIWRLVLIAQGASEPRLYLGLDTRADSLLIGCALGVWRHQRFAARDKPAPAIVNFLVKLSPLAAAALVYMCWQSPVLDDRISWLDRGGFTIMGLTSAVLVLGADRAPDSLLIRFLAHPWLTTPGRVSYGMYLWHFPVTAAAGAKFVSMFGPVGGVLAATAASLALATISFVTVERPAQNYYARKLKSKRAAAAVPPIATPRVAD